MKYSVGEIRENVGFHAHARCVSAWDQGSVWVRATEEEYQAFQARKVETAQPEVTVEVNSMEVTKAIAQYSMLGDEPGALDRFRRVFATWDFSQFAR